MEPWNLTNSFFVSTIQKVKVSAKPPKADTFYKSVYCQIILGKFKSQLIIHLRAALSPAA